MAIKVLVADDSEAVRQAVRRLLASQPEIEVVGEASDFAETIEMASALRPHVIVMDLHMSNEKSVTPDHVKSSLTRGASRVLAMSAWGDDRAVALAESFGAATFLGKMDLGKKLVPTIKEIASANTGTARV